MKNRPPLSNPVPVLPLRNGVLLPGTTITLPMGRPQSVALVQTVRPNDLVAVAVQRDPKVLDPVEADLLPVGVMARVVEAFVTPQGHRLTLEGVGRFDLKALVGRTPFWTAEATWSEETGDEVEAQALADALLDALRTALPGNRSVVRGLVQQLKDVKDPSELADRVAAAVGLTTEQEMAILLSLHVPERLRQLTRLVGEARATAEVRSRIETEVREELNKNQRDAILREQMRAIRKELGEDDEKSVVETLRKKLDEAGLSAEAREVADRELKRLESIPAQSPEHNVIRSYLEVIASLPWTARAEGAVDINKVKEKLDADHAGLTDVKKRILEHLAVMQRSGNPRGSILCFAGPPGVGKTSLGQSIADALGRPFLRVALGGVRDEAEIRGHRRTYIGALPGRVVTALKKAKVKNPVFLLDEIDKLAQGWQGNPEAALLEVLDPEQNKTFQDHYLELPFDLSEVLFICTANDLGNLSAPLRDRLEVIELSGYTADEKADIARSHLWPKALKEHAIGVDAVELTDEALRAVIGGYTRESGVRQLTRELTRICRTLTLEMAQTQKPDEKPARVVITEKDLKRFLGKVKFFNEMAERTQQPGVATGLAWTPVGGDILFIETSRMAGKGKIEITGQLGDVMKESARAALSYVRANATRLGIAESFLDTQDLHIHIPAGGIPKDGPSAGVTMFTALTSLLTGRRVRPDTAMTGECTLRGRVLPVGGIKEKVLAAHRAGSTRVILPRKNERDVEDIPAATREKMTFIFADDMLEVLEAALEPATDAQKPLVLHDGPVASVAATPANPAHATHA
jgi:ATP-dependent Lon protease